MSRSRSRGVRSIRNIQKLLGERYTSAIARPGSKLTKQANKGVCTIRNLSATMIYFYNKRFESGKFSIKVM